MPKYPFTPEKLDALPEELAELYRGLEDTLLKEICSRLKAQRSHGAGYSGAAVAWH